MSLFLGKMRQHINGHKELSEHKDVVKVDAGKEVLIPLFATHSTNFDVFVKAGDHVKVGTKLAQCNDRMIVPIYASVSGVVTDIARKCMHATLKPVAHIAIENDGKYETTQAFAPLDYRQASKAKLVEFMKNAGIVGCGGACFPTYIKYSGDAAIDTLIINAVECEPYITSDYKMVEAHMEQMLLGADAMKKTAGARSVCIAVKVSHPELIEQLKQACAKWEGMEVAAVADVYPMGWEKTLVQTILKKTYSRLPSEVGAIVNNASTAIALADALTKGMPLCEKIVTVSGDGVKDPINVQVRIGTSAKTIIDAIGGYAAEEVMLISGGPMMGKTIVNDQFVIDRAVNALTVLRVKAYDDVNCLRCGMCSDHCPAGLQPVRIAQAVNAKDKDMLLRLCANECVECGLCTYICPSRLNVTENVRNGKRQTMAALKK